MIFAVLDPSPLTVCINCSFFTFIIIRRQKKETKKKEKNTAVKYKLFGIAMPCGLKREIGGSRKLWHSPCWAVGWCIYLPIGHVVVRNSRYCTYVYGGDKAADAAVISHRWQVRPVLEVRRIVVCNDVDRNASFTEPFLHRFVVRRSYLYTGNVIITPVCPSLPLRTRISTGCFHAKRFLS